MGEVFEDDALRGELVANAVSLFEAAGLARDPARGNEPVDLGRLRPTAGRGLSPEPVSRQLLKNAQQRRQRD